MNVVVWVILIIIFLATLLKIPEWKFQLRKVKWQKEEGNCQIYDVPGSKNELWHYEDSGRKISVNVTWADMDNGFRIYMDGFEDVSGKISIEENKIIVARMMKYLGFVSGRNTLKLKYKGSDKPSDELIKQIEYKIKPFSYIRTNQDKNDEITWVKK